MLLTILRNGSILFNQEQGKLKEFKDSFMINVEYVNLINQF